MMAKVQLLAFISLDGYLVEKSVCPFLWESPDRYGITRIREKAVQVLDPHVSFLSLVKDKGFSSGYSLMEAEPDTVSVIESMFRFNLVDGIVLYVVPCFQGNGIRLFTEIPGPSLWKLAGNKSYHTGVCRMIYEKAL